MDQSKPLPAQRFIKRDPRVVEPTLVDVLGEAVSPGAVSHRWDRIKHCLQLHRLLRALALGQIEHECDALVAALFEKRGANKHWNAAAVFPNILLLEGWNDPRCVQQCARAQVALAPF